MVRSVLRKVGNSRHTALALVVILLAALAAMAVIPQRGVLTVDEMAAWRAAHPLARQAVSLLGLDHIATTPWFLLVLVLVLAALLVSLRNQTAIALRRARQLLASRPGGMVGLWDIVVGWGSPLLHLGLALVIFCALLLASTEQRVLLRLHEDETLARGAAPAHEEHGLFAKPLALPWDIRLEQVRADYWRDGSLKQLTSYLSLTDGAETRHCRLAINRPVIEHGLRFQQLERYGKAFFLLLSSEAATESVALLVKQPREAGQAAYGNFSFPAMPYALQAKYQPWLPAGRDLSVDRLTLRLTGDSGVAGQAILAVGQSGTLGPYTVRLLRVSQWAELVVSRSPGMGGIFAGFFLIMLGSGLLYLCPRR